MNVHLLRSVLVGLVLASSGVWCFADAPPPGLKELAPIKVEPFRGAINSLLFGPDGKILFSLDPFGTVKLWDVEKRNNIAALGTGIRQMDLSSDGKTLFSFANDNVCLWDVASCKRTALLERNLKEGSVLARTALSADGKTLAVLYGDAKTFRSHGKTVVVWDVASRKRIASVKAEHEIAWIMLNSDGKTLATVIRPGPRLLGENFIQPDSWDNLHVWDVMKGKMVRSFEKGLHLNPVSESLLLQSGPRHSDLARPPSRLPKFFPIKLIDPFTGDTVPTPEWDEKDRPPPGLFVLNRARTMLASFGPIGPVQLWDMASGKRIATFKHNEASFVFFSPDDKLLFIRSRSAPGLAIYAVPSGKLLAQLDRLVNMPLAMSPDGRLLAEPVFREIKLWSIPDEWRKKDK